MNFRFALPATLAGHGGRSCPTNKVTPMARPTCAYSEFSEAQEGRHLGKRVKLAALDPATRAHIESRLSLAAELALR